MQSDNRIKSLLARTFDRRTLLRGGLGLSVLGAAAATGFGRPASSAPQKASAPEKSGFLNQMVHTLHGHGSTEGILTDLPPEAPPVSWNAKTPADILTAFDYGRSSKLPDGRTLREYTLLAQETPIEVARGDDHRAGDGE